MDRLATRSNQKTIFQLGATSKYYKSLRVDDQLRWYFWPVINVKVGCPLICFKMTAANANSWRKNSLKISSSIIHCKCDATNLLFHTNLMVVHSYSSQNSEAMKLHKSMRSKMLMKLWLWLYTKTTKDCIHTLHKIVDPNLLLHFGVVE